MGHKRGELNAMNQSENWKQIHAIGSKGGETFVFELINRNLQCHIHGVALTLLFPDRM